MIKYLGSKRLLAPRLGEFATATEATTAVDLFTGTTRVAQEFKRRGVAVTAADVATYSQVLAECYVATDAAEVDQEEVADAIGELNALPGRRGYFTETFCERSRFLQPHNGARVDAIRDEIEHRHYEEPMRSILLTALLLAADRVDSTTGVQMAYLKSWSPRSHRDLRLEPPRLIAGTGTAVRSDATELVGQLPPVDLMYLDPPYNQHRYFTNYHVWETLIRWDRPDSYGIACKRVDARDEGTKSVFNRKAAMPAAFADVVRRARAEVLVVSYNDEAWITPEEMTATLRETGREEVRVLAFDAKRYVGAQIGIHDPAGRRVGKVKRLRNVEYLFLAGPRDRVEAGLARAAQGAGGSD